MNVSGQTDNQVMCNGVHQVPEAGVAIENIIQRCGLHSQILEGKKDIMEEQLTSTIAADHTHDQQPDRKSVV